MKKQNGGRLVEHAVGDEAAASRSPTMSGYLCRRAQTADLGPQECSGLEGIRTSNIMFISLFYYKLLSNLQM